MKKLVLVLSVVFVTMSSFTTAEKGKIISNELEFEQIEEDIPSCFQLCNAVGDIFRIRNGWTAVQTGAWINDCTASCENQ